MSRVQEERYRPYKWGNRIAIGLLAGQVLGMLHSPLAFPAAVAMPSLFQSAISRVVVGTTIGDPKPTTTEVEVALDRTDGRHTDQPAGEAAILTPATASTVDPAASSTTEFGDAQPGSTSAVPGGRPASGTAETTGTGGATSSATTAAGGSNAGGGASGDSVPPSTKPRPTPTSLSGPGTSSTATVPTTATTEDGGFDPVTVKDPCKLAATTTGSWVIKVQSGDEAAVALRRDVVAAATGVAADQFVLLQGTDWKVVAPAGPMCTASKLIEVVNVTLLP